MRNRLLYMLILLPALSLLLCTGCSAPTSVEEKPVQTEPPAVTADPLESDKKAYAEAAEAYYNLSDYEKAYNLLKDYEQSEYAPVQELLGTLLYNGSGCQRDFTKSLSLLSSSADNGNGLACYMMGYLKNNNSILGIDKDSSEQYFSKALPLLENQIKQDETCLESGRIMRAICYQYANGYGTKKNTDKAAQVAKSFLNRKDADPLLCYKIASDMTAFGFGNDQSAYKSLYPAILDLCENSKNPEALRDLSNYYYFGDGEVEQDYVRSFELMLQAAEAGDAISQNNLASMYANGIGTGKNMEQAMNWYSKSADQGYALAEYNLGVLLTEDSEDVAPNPAKAKSLFLDAANQSHVPSQNRLGLLFLDEKNYEDAFHWFEIAAEAGNVFAQYNVGRCYMKGYGCETDNALAREWLEKALEQGHSGAADLIASIPAKS